ncbi:MAG: hypothetical protein QOH67_3438 [Hyphomicrobiales bacterium]|jgi:hypothetical protein|nr:hypothetical protein [Hyphomicrobiales bacterium]
MLITVRGETTFHEVPDAPPTGVSLVPRGAAASSTSHGDDAGAGSVQFSVAGVSNAPSHDSTPVFSSAPLLPQSGAAPQFVSVSSVVTDLQGSTSLLRGAESPSSGGGGSEIARDGESLAPMSLAWADSSDNGWFIVPSAANEYGEAYAAAGDGFAWDVAAGEFTVDFFFV